MSKFHGHRPVSSGQPQAASITGAALAAAGLAFILAGLFSPSTALAQGDMLAQCEGGNAEQCNALGWSYENALGSTTISPRPPCITGSPVMAGIRRAAAIWAFYTRADSA